MKKCPFCAEEIQSEAIKCRYCGEWLNKKSSISDEHEQLTKDSKQGGQSVSLTKGASVPPGLSPRQSTVFTPPIEKNQKPQKSLSWKYLILAFVIAVVIYMFAVAVAAAGTKPSKNIYWTVIWIYLTIEAWKYWKWKALLPYPIYLVTVIIAGLIMVSIGVAYMSWTNLIVQTTLNIGGLIIFYILFRKSREVYELKVKDEKKWHVPKKSLAWSLAIIGFLVCIILLVVILTGKTGDSNPWAKKEGWIGNLNPFKSEPLGVLTDADLDPWSHPKPEPGAPALLPAPAPAPATGRNDRFIAYDNGTVLDSRTNLMWAANDNGRDINWADAKSYCENYRGGGYTDWRMPTQDELAVLYGSGNYKNVIEIAVWVWSSETSGSNAAFFDFRTGGRFWLGQSDGVYRALPVRSGKEVKKNEQQRIEKDKKDLAMARPPVPPEDDREFTSPILGAKFVLIPAGNFLMGLPSSEQGRGKDEIQHQVTISRSFYMQTTEVTQGQLRRVMGNNPSHFSSCGDDCPVEQVSWNDAQEFIGKLNRREGTDRYRLPTEAEWEYAARAGTTTRFYWGNQDDCSKANYGNSSVSSECKGTNPGKTMRVGSFPPNAWGLYDMHGNVWEWVQDWKGDYPSGSVTDPEGPSSGSGRVRRGGSWGNFARYCRSASRYGVGPGFRSVVLGFRLLRTR